MLNKDMTKADIDEALKGKGDYVKIDYLDRFLKSNPPLEKKKYAYQKLAEVYEQRGMFLDAAKCYNSISLCSITFAEKIKSHVKEAELSIKGGNLHNADEAMKKALGESNSAERENVKKAIKEFYKKQAEAYEKDNRRSHALKIYEKLLLMGPSDQEREEIKAKLTKLYEQTGRLKDYFRLKGSK